MSPILFFAIFLGQAFISFRGFELKFLKKEV